MSKYNPYNLSSLGNALPARPRYPTRPNCGKSPSPRDFTPSPKCPPDPKRREFRGRPTVVTVPGDYQTLDKALRSIGGNPFGYTIKLKSKCHMISTDHQLDQAFIRIEGDPAPFKGVGYIHKLGQWNLSRNYVQEYNANVGGLGPWHVELVEGPSSGHGHGGHIAIRGADGCDPDFSSVCPGDTMVLFRIPEEGEDIEQFTEHTICKGNQQSLFLDRGTPLPNDFCNFKMGEGVFIRPSTTIITQCPQQLQNTGRLEYSGIHFKVCPNFNTGSTQETMAIEHSTNFGSIEIIGFYTMYRPIVNTGKISITAGSGGRCILASSLGPDALIEHTATLNSTWQYAIHSGNTIGMQVINSGQVDNSFSDHFVSGIGILSRGSSRSVFRGNRFLTCANGVVIDVGGAGSALPRDGEELEDHQVEFNGCDIAISLDFSSHCQIDGLLMVNNPVNLTLDGVGTAVVNTASTIQETGTKISTFIYNRSAVS